MFNRVPSINVAHDDRLLPIVSQNRFRRRCAIVACVVVVYESVVVIFLSSSSSSFYVFFVVLRCSCFLSFSFAHNGRPAVVRTHPEEMFLIFALFSQLLNAQVRRSESPVQIEFADRSIHVRRAFRVAGLYSWSVDDTDTARHRRHVGRLCAADSVGGRRSARSKRIIGAVLFCRRRRRSLGSTARDVRQHIATLDL